MRSYTLLSLLLVPLMACGGADGGTGPQRASLAIVVTSGAQQVGTINSELPNPVVITVMNAPAARLSLSGTGGTPVAGQPVNWVVTSGGGTVFAPVTTTDSLGESRQRWTLGPDTGQQTLEARAVDPSTGEKITFATITARAERPPAPDIIKYVWRGHTITRENIDATYNGGTLIDTVHAGVPWVLTDHLRALLFDSTGTVVLRDAPVRFYGYQSNGGGQAPECATSADSTTVTCTALSPEDSAAYVGGSVQLSPFASGAIFVRPAQMMPSPSDTLYARLSSALFADRSLTIALRYANP